MGYCHFLFARERKRRKEKHEGASVYFVLRYYGTLVDLCCTFSSSALNVFSFVFPSWGSIYFSFQFYLLGFLSMRRASLLCLVKNSMYCWIFHPTPNLHPLLSPDEWFMWRVEQFCLYIIQTIKADFSSHFVFWQKQKCFQRQSRSRYIYSSFIDFILFLFDPIHRFQSLIRLAN